MYLCGVGLVLVDVLRLLLRHGGRGPLRPEHAFYMISSVLWIRIFISLGLCFDLDLTPLKISNALTSAL